MTPLTITATGLVYRNQKPHLRAIHAMHPSISRLDDGELVCTFDLGQGPESLDYHTELARSGDEGRTWHLQGPLITPPAGRRTTHTIRTSALRNRRLVGFGCLAFRDDPEEGVLNRANLGHVSMDLILIESRDGGRSWSAPRRIVPPFHNPAWEVCHALRELPNGDWFIPISTWRGWNGELPGGEQAGLMVSADGGQTWPVWRRTFDGRRTGLIHWEQGVVVLADGRVLATAWVYDPKRGRTKPTLYTLSRGDGRTFIPPQPTGFLAQTCKLLHLGRNRVLAVYRRDDRPGLWGAVARIAGDRWLNLGEAPLWTGAASGMAGVGTRSDELSGLKFGFPQMALLPTGEVFLVFWCQEDAVANIRWMRLAVGNRNRGRSLQPVNGE